MVNDLSSSVVVFYGLVFLLSYLVVYRFSSSHLLATWSFIAEVVLLLSLDIKLSMAIIFASISLLLFLLMLSSLFNKRRLMHTHAKAHANNASSRPSKKSSSADSRTNARAFWSSKKVSQRKLNDYIHILQNEIALRENAIPSNEREPHLYSDYSYAELKSELAALQAKQNKNKTPQSTKADTKVEHRITLTELNQTAPTEAATQASLKVEETLKDAAIDKVEEPHLSSGPENGLENGLENRSDDHLEKASKSFSRKPSVNISENTTDQALETALENDLEKDSDQAIEQTPERPEDQLEPVLREQVQAEKTKEKLEENPEEKLNKPEAESDEKAALDALRAENQYIEKQQWLEHIIERRHSKAIEIDKETLLQMSIEQLQKFAADLDKLDKLRDACPQLIPYGFQLTAFANQTLAVRYGIANIESNSEESRFLERPQTKIRLQKVRALGNDQYVVFLPDFGQQHALVKHQKGSELIEEFLPPDAQWLDKNPDLENLLKNADSLRLQVLAEHFHKKRLRKNNRH